MKLPERCAEVKPKFAFFQKQRERFAVNAVVFAQYTLRLVPKIFNTVDMILALDKRFAMVDAVMDKTAHIQFVITAQAVCINNTVRHDFLYNNRHQSIGLGIIYGNSLDPSVAFQNAEDNNFSCRTATTSALATSAEIAFVQFDRTGVMDKIGVFFET